MVDADEVLAKVDELCRLEREATKLWAVADNANMKRRPDAWQVYYVARDTCKAARESFEVWLRARVGSHVPTPVPTPVDATEYTRRSLGATLRAAREAAGLTQEALAKIMSKAQPMVSAAESGSIHVGERYTLAVLKACGLPKDWTVKNKRPVRSSRVGKRDRSPTLKTQNRKANQ